MGFSVLSNEVWSENENLENDYSPVKYNSSIHAKSGLEFADSIENQRHVRLKSQTNKMLCQNPSQIKNSGIREILAHIEQYDTLTQSDIVRNQYSTLPYPAVSHKLLAQEKAHYDNNLWPVKAYGEMRPKPFGVSFGITLEAINHYLFKGKNQFR